MTLDPSYLDYPKRREGMDHDLYPWSNLFQRKALNWAGGEKVLSWITVDLEWFPILPNDKPFRAPGHMATAYPDYRHYTSRDYGSRVGVYRLLDAFAKVGAKASFATNSVLAQRYPELIADILAAGHEIIAHATDMNATIASGLDIEEERAIIRDTLDGLEQATGTRPKGWLSIARSQSFNTPALLAEAGVQYMCDWVNDDLPFWMQTEKGRILNVPLNHELSDRQILNVQQQSMKSYVQQMQDAYNWLATEADQYGARMLTMNITPYITGLPYRMDEYDQLLAWLAAQPGHGFATGGEIAAAAIAQLD